MADDRSDKTNVVYSTQRDIRRLRCTISVSVVHLWTAIDRQKLFGSRTRNFCPVACLRRSSCVRFLYAGQRIYRRRYLKLSDRLIVCAICMRLAGFVFDYWFVCLVLFFVGWKLWVFSWWGGVWVFRLDLCSLLWNSFI